jgi:hypothetical protein
VTPEERVKVFIEHSQLMKDLKKAGELRRGAMAEAMKAKPAGSENV